MEENQALNFIIKLYNFLERKKVKYKIKSLKNLPYFA